MAKVTIVSTVPISIKEIKPGLLPQTYKLEKAKKDSFTLLVIGDAFELSPIPHSEKMRDFRRTPITAEMVADSVINDYIASATGTTGMPNEDGTLPVPGLFWIPGAVDAAEILAKHKDKLETAKRSTVAWMKNLVLIADNEWAKNRQSKFITKLQRTACNYLNVEREWNVDDFELKSNLCESCKSPVSKDAMICSNCRFIINPELYNKNKARFATA